MKFSNHTILITGGASGIGLELSRQLIQNQNKVIICGRTKEKLVQAQKAIPELEIYQCDISIEQQCLQLANWLQEKHPKLNVLINNAAITHTAQFMDAPKIVEMAEQEIQTNFIAPIRLTKLLSPILQRNPQPTIINITTGLVFAPKAAYPFYNATKAALHSFTQTLRMQLKSSSYRVIEVMFPVVKTPWHKGKVPDIAISAQQAVKEMLQGLEKGQSEIKVAGVKLLYWLARLAPNTALKKINTLK